MRLNPTRAIVLLVLCGLVSRPSSAQQPQKSASPPPLSHTTLAAVRPGRALGSARTLTPDDGLAVIAAALDSRIHPDREPDCSHLVHAIYARAGFPYSYAPSSDLYSGTREFQRVDRPQ